MNEPTERDVDAAVEAMVDTQDQFRESTTFHDLARAALAAVEPEVTARVNAAMAEARATRPSTSAEDWQTLDGRERHGYRRGMAEALDRVADALRGETP